jgi:hypothetical protein
MDTATPGGCYFLCRSFLHGAVLASRALEAADMEQSRWELICSLCSTQIRDHPDADEMIEIRIDLYDPLVFMERP